MPLRIAFDMDGVLADFSTAFAEVESRLFGPGTPVRAESPEAQAAQEERAEDAPEEAPTPRESRRRRDAIWKVIHDTPDFWSGLNPLDPGAVRRIHRLMLEHRWEVFFITQRPKTAGQTVQRQTQQWLVEQGFDLPSVLVISGSRGAAAGALRLDYHVDDSPQNCLDVVSDSKARPFLVAPDPDEVTRVSAKRLRIDVVPSVGDALDRLQKLSTGEAAPEPYLLKKLGKMVGW